MFEDCSRVELEVLIRGLTSIQSPMNDEQKEARDLCLGTLKHNLQVRYTQWDDDE